MQGTVVLIHGAWAGAWVWDALVGELSKLDLDTRTLELPGNGFHDLPPEDVRETDFPAAVDDAIGTAAGPVCLVGHSGGGMLVTYGADRHADKVTHAVWIAGMLLPNGESFDDIQDRIAGQGERFGITPHVVASEDGLSTSVPPDRAIGYFFNDLPERAAREAAGRLTPQPAAGRRLAVRTGPAFDRVRKLYILAGDDRTVIPEAQRMMAENAPGIAVREVDTGHCPHVSRPEMTAVLISDWLQTA